MRATFLAPLFLGILLTTGCQKTISEKDFIGNWTGSMSVAGASATDDANAKKARDLAASRVNDTPIPVEIRADKTFVMGLAGASIEGTWSFAAAKASLVFKKINGMDLEAIAKMGGASSAADYQKPMDLTLSEDGKTLAFKSPQGDLITLKKAVN